jgi:SAM-dependent methyltransferase
VTTGPDGLVALLDEFAGRAAVDRESAVYLRTHVPRYRFLLAEVERILAGAASPRILDVGPSWEAEAMRRLWPDAAVNTLGYYDARFPPRPGERHVELDLNDLQHRDPWPEPAEHDLVVVAEVLEHLYTAPQLVLRCLSTFLRPGGTMLLQTPNAAALVKRVKLLLGRNPYEPLRLVRHHPGHFREYTVDELLAVGREAGLEPVRWTARSYFTHGSRKQRLVGAMGPVLPPRLRDGLTVSFRLARGPREPG